LKNGVFKLDWIGNLHRAVPILVIGIAALLDIGIPFKIISNFNNCIPENPNFEFNRIILIGLLMISMLGVSLVRQLEDPLFKNILYFVMGFSSFWVVGALYYIVFVLSEPMNTNYEIFYQSILPITVFAWMNGVAILVALIDGKKNGMLFGSMGMGVVIISIVFTKIQFTNFIFSLLILLSMLWASIPILWIKILANYIDYNVSLTKRITKILKSILLTMPLYFIIGFLTYYLYFENIEMNVFSVLFFTYKITTDISLFIFLIGLLYIVTNFILVVSIFSIFDIVLKVFNLKKKIAIDGSINYLRMVKNNNPITQVDFDPFEDIIKEIKLFRKEFGKGKINRFATTQKIGAFRENIDLIYAKHKKGSKDMALKLLRQIEKESEFAFK
jgi:hypothetical protein